MKYFSRSDRFYFDNVSGVPSSSHSLMVMTKITGHKNIGVVPSRNVLHSTKRGVFFLGMMAKVLPCNIVTVPSNHAMVEHYFLQSDGGHSVQQRRKLD